MRRLADLAPLVGMVLVGMAAPACSRPPPAVPEPAVVVVPVAAPEPSLAVAEEPAPAAQVAEDSLLLRDLAGAWAWTGDVQEFRMNGTGTYYRDGAVCYEFQYRIAGHVVTTVADRDHSCGAKRENDWLIYVTDGELDMKHQGSGYETHWTPAERP